MAGNERRTGGGLRGWLWPVAILALALAAGGAFGGARAVRPAAVNPFGVALMLAGLALVIGAGALAKRLFPSAPDRAAVLGKLLGLAVCVAGAIAVIYA